jgi:hypothetical protein
VDPVANDSHERLPACCGTHDDAKGASKGSKPRKAWFVSRANVSTLPRDTLTRPSTPPGLSLQNKHSALKRARTSPPPPKKEHHALEQQRSDMLQFLLSHGTATAGHCWAVQRRHSTKAWRGHTFSLIGRRCTVVLVRFTSPTGHALLSLVNIVDSICADTLDQPSAIHIP